MRGILAFRAAHTVPPSGHICHSIMSLETSPSPLPVGTMHVSRYEWFIVGAPFFFSLSSFENYRLVIFVVDISTLILILLIYDFYS